MVKGNPKSSASSATRKKHARKHAAADDQQQGQQQQAKRDKPKTKAERAKAKKEPRVKVYIPPTKPAPVQPDPLETTGLAHTLPADLLIVLRNLSKKAQVTKIRALEDLQSSWVDRCLRATAGQDPGTEEVLVEMLPVWLHHVSALFIHPSRRVRLTASALHASLLQIPSVQTQILFILTETAPQNQIESILGTWALAAHDADRLVSQTSFKSWSNFISTSTSQQDAQKPKLSLDDTLKACITSFVQRAALDPSGVYLSFNPPQPAIEQPLFHSKGRGGGKGPQGGRGGGSASTPRRDDSGDQTPRSKGDEQEESDTDRRARLRIAALNTLRWILGVSTASKVEDDHAPPSTSLVEDMSAFLNNPALWTSLYSNEWAPWIPLGHKLEAFGHAQPNVRKAAWGLVQTLVGNDGKKWFTGSLPVTLGVAILRSAWIELDSLVQGAMWQPLLMFLKEYPQSWTWEEKRADDDESDKDEDSDEEVERDDQPTTQTTPTVKDTPIAPYLEFLQFLRLGCNGSAAQGGYPAIVVILSTIPRSVMALVPPRADVETTEIATNSDAPTPPIPFAPFFDAFWSALDSRALTSLHRATTSTAFLSSLLECSLFLVKRLRNQPPEADTEPPSAPELSLVVAQLRKVWDTLCKKRLHVEPRAAGRFLGKTLEDLRTIDGDGTLFTKGWETISKRVLEGSSQTGDENLWSLSAAVLKVLYDRWRHATPDNPDGHVVLKTKAATLFRDVGVGAAERLRTLLKDEDVSGPRAVGVVMPLLEQFREGLFEDTRIASDLDALLQANAPQILQLSPAFATAYLGYRKSQNICQNIWHTLLSHCALSAAVQVEQPQSSKGEASFSALIQAAKLKQLPTYLTPNQAEGELDAVVGELLEKVLAGASTEQEKGVLEAILESSTYFISSSRYQTFVDILIATFNENVKRDLAGADVPLISYELSVGLLRLVVSKESEGTPEHTRTTAAALMPNTFLFAYLLPISHGWAEKKVLTDAKEMWQIWSQRSGVEEAGEVIVGAVKARLAEYLASTESRPTPTDILDLVYSKPPGIKFDLLSDIFPKPSVFNTLLESLPADALDPTLAILDNRIPPFRSPSSTTTSIDTDQNGFSSYARLASALLQTLTNDLHLAKKSLWALRHFLALSLYAQDLERIPSSAFTKDENENNRWPFDSSRASKEALNDVVRRVKQVAVYLFSGLFKQDTDEDAAAKKKAVVKRLLQVPTGAVSSPNSTNVTWDAFLAEVVQCAIKKDAIRDARILFTVLGAVLPAGDTVQVEEADLWLQLARKIETSAPETSMCIVSAIVSTGSEPNRLDRYRNELAASLLGIKPAQANTVGFLTLRKLDASAPEVDSDVVFLPSVRAVNAIKALQSWVLGGDEDNDDEDEMDEQVESAMLPLFRHLAPILQNVPGGHWEFVFDVLEGVLERAKSSQPKEKSEEGEEEDGQEDLVALSRALKLVNVLEDLARANKSLRAEWETRRKPILVMIRDLAVLSKALEGDVSGAIMQVSEPRSVCRELVLAIVRELPSSLMDKDMLGNMVHLIEDPSTTVQRMAYQLLQTAAKIRTEYFVIEAGVDTEGAVQFALPPELLEIVGRSLTTNLEEDENLSEDGIAHLAFGYLLAWMILFDLFQDASFKVKSTYIDQLRDLNIAEESLIPSLFHLLSLGRGSPQKAFKLDIWAVDRFYVEYYQGGHPHSIPVFAAHVYYRALLTIPSLIRSWLTDCKDRQLTGAVTGYTSAYFSPVLIGSELDYVRQQALVQGENALSDDNMTVKVASAINEVVAAYTVDDQRLELKLKIPTDWPLHRVEVSDAKPVGVDENRWRVWVLGVVQIIWAHNGRLVDGLSLFKKNVALHFAGQVECAICYSIINVTDGSLPKKPCKTCKNRFHAGCLYQWFNSSHSSSCPLCRSQIL